MEKMEMTQQEQELFMMIKNLVKIRKSLPNGKYGDFSEIEQGLDEVIEKLGEAFILLVNQ